MLTAIDVIGVRDFVYGGDPEWVRRRWLLAVSLAFNALLMLGALVSAAAGRLPVDLAVTVISSGFGLIMVVVPGFIGIAAYERKELAKNAGLDARAETLAESRPETPRDIRNRERLSPEGAG